MKRFFCALLLAAALPLAGCSPIPAGPDPSVPAAMPVQAASAEAEPQLEPQPEPQPEPEPESQPEPLESGGYVLLFGQRTAALRQTDGTLLIPAAAFAERGGLSYGETDSWAELRHLGDRIRFPLCGPFTTAVRQDGTVWIPFERAAAHFGFVSGTASDGTPYCAREVSLSAPAADVNVPVLMYHAVGDETWGYSDLFVRPQDLDAQLQYLADNGYETIWFEDLSHLEDYEKPVILTFDDGYDDNYTELYPLLQKYQAKATIFVIPRDLGKAHKMTAEQIQELADSGLVSIQSHTWSHGNLSQMDEATLIFEMEESQNAIAALTGQVPYVVCYPEGTKSDLSIAVARRYYAYGLLMNGYVYNTSDDPFYVQRMFIPRGQISIEWNVRDAGTHRSR